MAADPFRRIGIKGPSDHGSSVWGMSYDRYGRDVLAEQGRTTGPRCAAEVVAARGMVVEDATTGWCGEVVAVERDLRTVTLEDRHRKRRTFPLGPGFLLEGAPVVLLPAGRQGPRPPTRTPSGSLAVPAQTARVARASRILVEGRHDAELVEKVWGDDLRVEGVVVEELGGVDGLPGRLQELAPGPGRRIGVLVDHLVPGSKERRIADAVTAGSAGRHVLVVGHPFVDVWQAVRPALIGRAAWPPVPRGTDWKTGVCQALGWPHRDHADIARAWRRLLGLVRSYADLEPALLGRVEELIDFVTQEAAVSERGEPTTVRRAPRPSAPGGRAAT
jgi:hypothetical protein